ncbi:MAG: hypothetical protein WKF31_09615 [Thermoleophilaceae bacterium]
MFENVWGPVGTGVKSEEEVDALALYLFGDSDEGREHARSIDATVSEMPGLEGLRLLGDVVDRAVERARATPGYAGTPSVPAHPNGDRPAGAALGPRATVVAAIGV